MFPCVLEGGRVGDLHEGQGEKLTVELLVVRINPHAYLEGGDREMVA